MANPQADDAVLTAIGERALEFVRDGCIVGLGTGRAAAAFVRALGRQVQHGLRVTAVPTSESTAAAARDLGIQMVTLDETEQIDVTVDGADEVDPHLDLIKGYGGALVREKIVAAASKLEVILVGSEKLVAVLGQRGKLPVEVLSFAAGFCASRLAALGCRPQLRRDGDRPFVSDGGNYILDCGVDPITEPGKLEDSIRSIPGVVGTGLFLGMAQVVLVGNKDGTVRELRKQGEAA